jgi:hypothetical protein
MSGQNFLLNQNFLWNTMRLSSAAAPVVAVLAFGCATQAVGADMCTPTLTIGDVHFTEMQPPMRSRTWSAVVSVDASHCAANSIGTFDIVFVREKESAPDLEFREHFVWRAPSVKVQVDFAADEAVQSYRIDNITPCDCRD